MLGWIAAGVGAALGVSSAFLVFCCCVVSAKEDRANDPEARAAWEACRRHRV